MIYLIRRRNSKYWNDLRRCLQPDGLLFAGHSESFHNAGHVFSLRGKNGV